MSLIQTVKSANLCIGCGYCASLLGIGMEHDSLGYLVPNDGNIIPDAVNENLIRLSCPGLNGDSVVNEDTSSPDANTDYMWGRYFIALTGHSVDQNIRHLGSSGGVITAICSWLVDSGQVDGVLVTTYDAAYPMGTQSTVTSDLEWVYAAGGSKYCPAAPLTALRSIKNSEGRYAVVGRPCDISTLRRAISAGDPIGRNIKYLFSFFCAGTPSDAGNRALLARLGVEDANELVHLRHRGNGWPGDTVAQLADGTSKTCNYNQSWGGVLRNHIHSLCKVCPDGIGEQSDIVAADAWYGDDLGYPKFEETSGRSLILARTMIGMDLLNDAVKNQIIAVSPISVREIDRMQPGQIARRRQLSTRVAAYRLMGLQVPRYDKRALRQYARGLSAINRIVIILATLRRLVLRKLRKNR